MYRMVYHLGDAPLALYYVCYRQSRMPGGWQQVPPLCIIAYLFPKRNAKKKYIIISICMSYFSGIFRSSPKLKMDILTDSVKERTRHTRAYKIPNIDVSGLIGLSSRLEGEVLRDFNHDYGNLLSILKTSFDPMALITLFQFYDPQLRCFTFQDYQLVPTLEEFSYILNIRITDDVPFVRVPEVVSFEKNS